MKNHHAVLAATCLSAASTFGQSDGLRCTARDYQGHLDKLTLSAEFVEQDGLLYYSSGALHVVDVSDPHDPTIVGAYQPQNGGSARAVCVEGATAFLGAGNAGGYWIEVLNLSQPTLPERIGYIHGLKPQHMEVRGPYLYIAAGTFDGLQIYDVSDPRTPVFVSQFNTQATDDIELSRDGTIAYIKDFHGPLEVIEVSDPTNPVRLTTINAQDSIRMVTDGDVLYIPGYSGRLELFDISNPSTPQFLWRSDIPSRAVAVRDNIAYSVSINRGMRLFDVTDPAAPRRIGQYDIPGDLEQIALLSQHPDTAVVFRDGQGFAFFDVSSQGRADPLLGYFDFTGTIAGGDTDNGIAIVALGFSGFQLLDVGIPQAPVWLAQYSATGTAQNAFVRGDTAYLAYAGSGLHIVDISSPASPVRIGHLPAIGATNAVVVRGNIAYMTETTRGFRTVDVSDPTNPTLIAAINPGVTMRRFALHGDYALIAAREAGMLVVSIADPAALTVVGTLEVADDAWDVAVDGNTAVLASGDTGAIILNIEDPTAPIVRNVFLSEEPVRGVECRDGMAYLANDERGVVQLQLSDPLSIQPLAELPPVDQAANIWLNGDIAYADMGLGVLQIIDISDCAVCVADIDQNDVVNTQDFIAFLNAWAAERSHDCTSGDCLADLNNDGTVDTRDFIEFLDAWAAGC